GRIVGLEELAEGIVAADAHRMVEELRGVHRLRGNVVAMAVHVVVGDAAEWRGNADVATGVAAEVAQHDHAVVDRWNRRVDDRGKIGVDLLLGLLDLLSHAAGVVDDDDDVDGLVDDGGFGRLLGAALVAADAGGAAGADEGSGGAARAALRGAGGGAAAGG